LSRLRSKELLFNAGDKIFDDSLGEVHRIIYHYIVPSDIVQRAIHRGFHYGDPILKPNGFALHLPSENDSELELNSSVDGAQFIKCLLAVRRALGDASHQFLPFSLFIDGMSVNKTHKTSKTPLKLYDLSSGEEIVAALIPAIEVVQTIINKKFSLF
jgi:hypothetical protein